MPAMPSCTVAGAFGIARTTGTPSAIRSSMYAVGMAAATETTVCSGVRRTPISASKASMSCGLTATTTIPAPAIAAALSAVASTPYRSCSSATRSAPRLVMTISEASRQPELSKPERRASPIRPPPRIAIFLFMPESLGRASRGQRYQAAAEAGEEIHAREARPLSVWLEQLRRLPGLHGPPTAQSAHELDQPEIADEPVLVAAEPLEADDARRPGAETPLAL